MDTTAIPTRLAVRLALTDREALATITGAIATQHRRAPTVTDAVRAAFSIAAEAVRSRGTNAAAL